MVANVNAVDSDPLNAPFSSRLRASTRSSDTGSESETNSDSARSNEVSSRFIAKLFDPFFSGRTHRTVEEDPSSRLVTKHIFSKMMIEASDHPFFKRVWLARHVLDDNSPIVKARIRRQIRKNNGSWPDRLNTHAGIRDSLEFNQILVSLNGVSNVSASDVYAQKIYDFVDINVGYQFVNILYRDSDGSLGVDVSSLRGTRSYTPRELQVSHQHSPIFLMLAYRRI